MILTCYTTLLKVVCPLGSRNISNLLIDQNAFFHFKPHRTVSEYEDFLFIMNLSFTHIKHEHIYDIPLRDVKQKVMKAKLDNNLNRKSHELPHKFLKKLCFTLN